MFQIYTYDDGRFDKLSYAAIEGVDNHTWLFVDYDKALHAIRTLWDSGFKKQFCLVDQEAGEIIALNAPLYRGSDGPEYKEVIW
jgi:hypothetical protein